MATLLLLILIAGYASVSVNAGMQAIMRIDCSSLTGELSYTPKSDIFSSKPVYSVELQADALEGLKGFNELIKDHLKKASRLTLFRNAAKTEIDFNRIIVAGESSNNDNNGSMLRRAVGHFSTLEEFIFEVQASAQSIATAPTMSDRQVAICIKNFIEKEKSMDPEEWLLQFRNILYVNLALKFYPVFRELIAATDRTSSERYIKVQGAPPPVPRKLNRSAIRASFFQGSGSLSTKALFSLDSDVKNHPVVESCEYYEGYLLRGHDAGAEPDKIGVNHNRWALAMQKNEGPDEEGSRLCRMSIHELYERDDPLETFKRKTGKSYFTVPGCKDVFFALGEPLFVDDSALQQEKCVKYILEKRATFASINALNVDISNLRRLKEVKPNGFVSLRVPGTFTPEYNVIDDEGVYAFFRELSKESQKRFYVNALRVTDRRAMINSAKIRSNRPLPLPRYIVSPSRNAFKVIEEESQHYADEEIIFKHYLIGAGDLITSIEFDAGEMGAAIYEEGTGTGADETKDVIIDREQTTDMVKLILTVVCSRGNQFDTIKIEGFPLMDEDIWMLGEAFKCKESRIKKLSLTRAGLGDSDLRFLIRNALSVIFRRKKGGLQKLSLAHNNLGERGFAEIAWLLAQENSALEELDLSHNTGLDFLNDGIVKLAKGLASPKCQLRKLALENCRIIVKGAKALAHAIVKRGSSAGGLKALNLDNNYIGSGEGIKEISEIFKSENNLNWLSLRNNGIGKVGLEAMGAALGYPMFRCKTLILGGHEQALPVKLHHLHNKLAYGRDSDEQKARTIVPSRPSTLQESAGGFLSKFWHLLLNRNDHGLADHFFNSIPLGENNNNVGATIEHLDISGLWLRGSPDRLVQLLTVSSKKLGQLGMADCDLEDDQLRAIGNALQKCTHLRKLDLSGNKRLSTLAHILPLISGTSELQDLKLSRLGTALFSSSQALSYSLISPNKLVSLDISESITDLKSALKTVPRSNYFKARTRENKEKLSSLLESGRFLLPIIEVLGKSRNQIRHLNLAGCALGPDMMRELSKSVASSHCKLKSLNLDYNHFNNNETTISTGTGGKRPVALLIEALKENTLNAHKRRSSSTSSNSALSGLESLSIRCNGIEPNDEDFKALEKWYKSSASLLTSLKV